MASSLTRLEIKSSLDDEGAVALASALAMRKGSLRSLTLYEDHYLRDKGAVMLAASLGTTHKSLECLDLHNNDD